MERAKFLEFLTDHYKFKDEILNIKKEQFITILKISYGSFAQIDWNNSWKNFNKLSISEKIAFFVDDDILGKVFEGFVFGLKNEH